MNFDEDNIRYNPFGTPKMRIQTLAQMLSTLSCNALEYVWRPILYAYQQIDEQDADALSFDDRNCFDLIGIVAHGSPEYVDKFYEYKLSLIHQREAQL